jgi:hypothetical protein
MNFKNCFYNGENKNSYFYTLKNLWYLQIYIGNKDLVWYYCMLNTHISVNKCINMKTESHLDEAETSGMVHVILDGGG